MGISGKIIGGLLGCSIGGPLGGILGLALGHAFDKKNDPHENKESGQHIHHESSSNKQMTFFVATFSMLGKMACADGNISEQERRTVEKFINNDLNFNPQERAFAMRIFDTASTSGEDFQKFAQQFYECFANEPQIIETMMDILVRLSLADEVLSSREEQFIASAALCFRYPAANVEALKRKYSTVHNNSEDFRKTGNNNSQSDDLEWAYSVLSCVSSDSNEEIKARYKKLIKEYHPDVIASKGLPEEFTEFANKKFQQIQSAYETIKKHRKI